MAGDGTLDPQLPLWWPACRDSRCARADPSPQHPVPGTQPPAPQLALGHDDPSLWYSGRPGGCLDRRPEERHRPGAQRRLCPLGAGPSAVHQRFPRRGDLRVGGLRVARTAGPAGIVRRAGCIAGRALRHLSGLARSRRARGPALRAGRLVDRSAAAPRPGAAAGPDLPRGDAARSVGHLRSWRMALGRRAPWRDDFLPLE